MLAGWLESRSRRVGAGWGCEPIRSSATGLSDILLLLR